MVVHFSPHLNTVNSYVRLTLPPFIQVDSSVPPPLPWYDNYMILFKGAIFHPKIYTLSGIDLRNINLTPFTQLFSLTVRTNSGGENGLANQYTYRISCWSGVLLSLTSTVLLFSMPAPHPSDYRACKVIYMLAMSTSTSRSSTRRRSTWTFLLVP